MKAGVDQRGAHRRRRPGDGPGRVPVVVRVDACGEALAVVSDDGLTQLNATTPRSLPAVQVASSGRIGIAWIEGAEPAQSLRFVRYGTVQCPSP